MNRCPEVFIVLLRLAFIVLSIAGLSLGESEWAQAKTVTTCSTDYAPQIMPFFIAKENHYFEMEGLNVNTLVARGDLCTMALIRQLPPIYRLSEHV